MGDVLYQISIIPLPSLAFALSPNVVSNNAK